MDARDDDEAPEPPTEERILDAAIAVLARDGVAGVSMRAVAHQAGVAVGLANYHFENKTEMIAAALERIGDRDLEILSSGDEAAPDAALRASLRSALDSELLTPDHLSLRLQLWSLAGVDDRFSSINRRAQQRYLGGLVDLLSAVRPELELDEVRRRAADILIVQNGVWLTAILIADAGAVQRALERCEALAFD